MRAAIALLHHIQGVTMQHVNQTEFLALADVVGTNVAVLSVNDGKVNSTTGTVTSLDKFSQSGQTVERIASLSRPRGRNPTDTFSERGKW